MDWALQGKHAVSRAELGGFYFIFPVGGDWVVTSAVPGQCVKEVVGDRRREVSKSLPVGAGMTPVKVASFCS